MSVVIHRLYKSSIQQTVTLPHLHIYLSDSLYPLHINKLFGYIELSKTQTPYRTQQTSSIGSKHSSGADFVVCTSLYPELPTHRRATSECLLFSLNHNYRFALMQESHLLSRLAEAAFCSFFFGYWHDGGRTERSERG